MSSVKFALPRFSFSEIAMDSALLSKTAAGMVAKGKGILAADESSGTCETRFKSVGVDCTEEKATAFFTTPGRRASGVILLTKRSARKRTTAFRSPNISKEGNHSGHQGRRARKDMPLHPGEKVTEGLDGLSKRLQEYFKLGARFAKWRAVITIGPNIPSHACIYANAHALARYAAACVDASIVPIIEPEVLLDGDHTAERSEEVHEATLRACYAALAAYDVAPEHVILKASMVVSGKNAKRQAGVDEVAERTVRVLKRTVPAAQPGVVFSPAASRTNRRPRISMRWPR